MKYMYVNIMITYCLMLTSSVFSQPIKLSSPDGKNIINITTQNDISYEVRRNGEIIVAKSPISMKVGETEWGKDSDPRKVSTENFKEEVSLTIPRKSKVINEEYNRILLTYRDYLDEFRAYNDGVAYRFIGNKDEEKLVVSESVIFNFPGDYETYTLLTHKLQNWFEEDYTIEKILALPQDSLSITPVMVDARNCKLLIAEANLVNYPGMYLQPSGKSFKGIFANYPHTEEVLENGNKLYVVARRSGDTWFIGAMNGEEPLDLEINLSFLDFGEKQLTAHADGINAFKQAKDFRIISEKIVAGQKLKIEMSKGGGYTAIIK